MEGWSICNENCPSFATHVDLSLHSAQSIFSETVILLGFLHCALFQIVFVILKPNSAKRMVKSDKAYHRRYVTKPIILSMPSTQPWISALSAGDGHDLFWGRHDEFCTTTGHWSGFLAYSPNLLKAPSGWCLPGQSAPYSTSLWGTE